MESISSLLESRLRMALRSVTGLEDATAGVQAVADARFGDYQTNAAMLLAKQQRANPRQLAEQIVAALRVADLCEAPVIAGPGFINFRLKNEYLAERFALFAGDERLGVAAPREPRTVVIDFSSPNVAKPMHVGHIRSTFLGDALARIAAFRGDRVIRDNHVGDWGTQFGMLLVGWKADLDREALARDPLGEMERIYKLISGRCKEDAATLENARSELRKLQAGDGENLAIWREMIALSQGQFDTVYGKLGVRFDVTLGESFYNSRLAGVIAELEALGIARESEGALCVFSDGKARPEEDPFLIKDREGWRPNPAIVRKSDGAANYTTTDLATLDYRISEWDPDEILYVTDGRQQLHFRQLFAIFGRWRPTAPVKLAHVWFGAILGEDGRPFKTRSGETVKLAELLEEAGERAAKLITEKNPDLDASERGELAQVIGLGALKYADLLPNRQGDYVFSWDKMLSFQGNTAPYLQYSYVRIRSIFRRAAEAGVETAANRGAAPAALELREDAEICLVKKLFQYAEIIPRTLDDCRPNLLCNYLYELAASFHAFFEQCPVLKAPNAATRASRLALCDATARTLQNGLGLLGIAVPERM